MTPPFRIKWADQADKTVLIPLMLSLYADDPADGDAPTHDDAARHIDQILSPDTPHRLAIATGEDGAALGLAAVAIFLSINEAQADRRRQMELKELFVLPDHRSEGVGEALMFWIEDQAAAIGVHRMDWHVKAGNSRAIAFYERLGGRIVRDRLSMRKIHPGADHES